MSPEKYPMGVADRAAEEVADRCKNCALMFAVQKGLFCRANPPGPNPYPKVENSGYCRFHRAIPKKAPVPYWVFEQEVRTVASLEKELAFSKELATKHWRENLYLRCRLAMIEMGASVWEAKDRTAGLYDKELSSDELSRICHDQLSLAVVLEVEICKFGSCDKYCFSHESLCNEHEETE